MISISITKCERRHAEVVYETNPVDTGKGSLDSWFVDCLNCNKRMRYVDHIAQHYRLSLSVVLFDILHDVK